MPVHAVRIDTDGRTSPVDLPEDTAGLRSALRGHLGGIPEQAVYHQRSLLWVHGDGQGTGLAPNLTAWALASAWRRTPLPYQFYGAVVVTGGDGDGASTLLDDDLAGHAHTVAATVQSTMAAWRRRPPASTDAAVSELLAYVVRDVRDLS